MDQKPFLGGGGREAGVGTFLVIYCSCENQEELEGFDECCSSCWAAYIDFNKRQFLLNFQEQYANVTAVRTGIPYNPASLAEPVVYNIGKQTFLISHHSLITVLLKKLC